MNSPGCLSIQIPCITFSLHQKSVRLHVSSKKIHNINFREEKNQGFFSFPFGWSTLLCPHKWRIMFPLNRWTWLRTFYQTTTKSNSMILTAGSFSVDLQNVYLPKTSPHIQAESLANIVFVLYQGRRWSMVAEHWMCLYSL